MRLFETGRGMIRGAMVTLLLCAAFAGGAQAEDAEDSQYRQWVQEMKQRARGPFLRLRWFCEDGAVLPPEPFACEPHGGGVQHGELTTQAREIREAGYYIANVLAGGKGATMGVEIGQRDELIGTLLEQYLIHRDDGWIYRRARTYRGAIQGENESAAARALLYRLAQLPSLPNQDFLLLREAYRLLPGRLDSPAASRVRELSATLAERDPGFASLRAKIHGQPDAQDARRVRDYAATHPGALSDDYEEMAAAIDALFRKPDIGQALQRLRRLLRSPSLRAQVDEGWRKLQAETRVDRRMILAGGLLAQLRLGFSQESDSNTRLEILAAGLVLEQEVFRTARQLPAYAGRASRLQQVTWLGGLVDASYGTGLISARQWQALKKQLKVLQERSVPLQDYYQGLKYLARAPAWASHWLGFHFARGVEKLSALEPKVAGFVPDRLRGSALLVYSQILDGLADDAHKAAGVQRRLFGERVGASLRPLNAGLARGRLYTRPPANGRYDPKGIYLLSETTPELKPVAGILTQGEGNALSHVQLLASNLGVPNVVVAERLLPRLKRFEGQQIVMAVSPGGSVEIAEDSPEWDARLQRGGDTGAGRISPDESKLDLDALAFVPLSKIRARDSGRIAGPKAANLGELKHVFPDAVTDGLVVPFGRFRAYLDMPGPTGEPLYTWMKRRYARLEGLSGRARQQATSRLLAEIRRQILRGDPGPDFREELRRALAQVFGPGEGYAVFVRSDTNVEDLPGFTGAGLNLTLPNVRGFESLVEAIKQVWASPFTERAFAWRQQRMDRPELVFPSVLLLRSVGVDKSGVMLTMDPETGREDVLSIAVNHGIGGAVQGQQAEELRIDRQTGEVRILNDATSPAMRVLSASGGLVQRAVPADGDVLEAAEIRQLVAIADAVDKRLPQYDADGRKGAADIEFGFQQGRRVLFQIRPFLRDAAAYQHQYLLSLDKGIKRSGSVDMHKPPKR